MLGEQARQADKATLPEKIGPYAVTGLLGQGGMGVVYAAQHRDTGALAAVKTLSTEDNGVLVGIRSEIHALKRLDHPGVVRIVGDGVSDGVPWYAMEMLSGSTLRSLLNPGTKPLSKAYTLPPTATASGNVGAEPVSRQRPRWTAHGSPSRSYLLSLLRRACAGLAHLHESGIVHRDLKPENLFVRDDGTPVWVDFGIASGFAGAPGREILAAAGTVVGTVAYMSPEQIRGELVDARTDLYALGCMLYECLTGAPPFVGLATNGILHAHLHNQPLPPSELADAVPEELDYLVLRLLEKEPAARLGYADDVARLLRNVIEDAADTDESSNSTYMYRPPFVGREAAMTALKTALRLLDRDGTGGQVYIAGESGAGKTRLAMEIARDAGRLGLTVVVSRCDSLLEGEPSTRGGPLHAIAPLLLAITDHCRALGTPESTRLFGRHGKVLARYQSAIRELPDFASWPAPTQTATVSADLNVVVPLVETVVAFAAVRPCVLLIDDLQRADPLSLEFLRALSKTATGDLSLLIVGTYRADEGTDELREIVSLEGNRVAELVRLDKAEVAAMLRGLLAMPDVPKSLVEFLHDKCEGNPFFLVEYVRAAIAEGILTRNNAGHWRLGGPQLSTSTLDFSSLSLPSNLVALLERRLLDLDQASREVLQTAAVLGREFDTELLFSCLDTDVTLALDALFELRKRQILEQAPGGRLRFAHDRLRSVAYRSITDIEKRVMHRRAAEAIEGAAPADVAAPETLAHLGHHWSLAQQHAKASRYFLRAAEHASSMFAHKDAITHYLLVQREESAALSVGELDAPQHDSANLYEAIGSLYALTGQQRAARQALMSAMEFEHRALKRAQLWRKIGKTHETQHEHGDALQAYEEAERALGPAATEGDAAGVHRHEAWWTEWVGLQIDRVMVHYWLADDGRIEPLVEQIRARAIAGGAARQRAQLFKSLAYMGLRRERFAVSSQTVSHARDRLEASKEWGDAGEVLESQFMLALTLLCHGELEQAQVAIEAALPVAEQRGDVTILSRFVAYFALTLRRRGSIERAYSVALQCLDLAGASGIKEYIGVARANLGWVAWRRGEFEDAQRESLAAIDVWHGLSLVYSFEWMARFVLMALANRVADLATCAQHAARILDPKQQALPAKLTEALTELCATPSTSAVERVLHLARQHAFL